MEFTLSSATTLSDAALASEVVRLASDERRATAQLIAALAEFDARRLYLPAGCSSLFTYCIQVLHLSEHAAYNRIEAARAARRHPQILDRLAAGELTLTTVTLLAPHLTEANLHAVLQDARHKSKREVEHIVAALRPRPDVPSTVRKLPDHSSMSSQQLRDVTASPASSNASDTETRSVELGRTAKPDRRPALMAPVAPERYKVQFTVSRGTHDKLRRAQDLLRHVIPSGDPAEIFDRALTLLVAQLERRKLAAVKRPRDSRGAPRTRQRTRHIPAAVRREVWARDAGRCAFLGIEGRCTERGALEFHHVFPYADGGEATAANIQLRCRRHNHYESVRWFGDATLPGVVRETWPVWQHDAGRSRTRPGTSPREPRGSADRVGPRQNGRARQASRCRTGSRDPASDCFAEAGTEAVDAVRAFRGPLRGKDRV